MSKIAIISQPDQGVLIDVSGCSTLQDALDHLSSTLQVSNQFWQGMKVSINLGSLAVQKEDLQQILTLAKSVGIMPSGVYSTSDQTIATLKALNIPLGAGKPMTLPAVNIDSAKMTTTEIEDEKQKANPLATITMRMVDAVTRRSGSKEHVATESNELEDMVQEEFDHKSESLDTLYPHVKRKRKVSLDGKRIQQVDDDEIVQPAKAQKAPEKVEVAAKAKRKLDDEGKVEPAAVASAAEERLYAPTVEMKSVQVPPTAAVDVSVVEPVQSKTVDQANSKEDQEITGPHVEIKVMTIQPGQSMLEAHPAQTAVAQAATIDGEVVTHIDVDCSVAEKETAKSTVQDEDEDVEDVENAEEFEIEEEIETDVTDDVGRAARNGPTTLYIRQNLRSGQTVSHKGHLVIIGDINPGAEVMADGDITVWGSLRGVAHAGIGGNVNAEIRALKLQPIQIRIAHAIARAPDRPRVSYAAANGPETARMVDGKIRVVKSRLD